MGVGLQKAGPRIYDTIVIVPSKASMGIHVACKGIAIGSPPEVGHRIAQ
jgi:hypothetical protein